MKNILLFIAGGAVSAVSLSCLNPFAPRLNTELESQTCSDLTKVENIFCSFRNAYSFRDTTIYGTLIASDFTFIYTDYDRAVDVSWGREDEMKVTYGLFQNVQSLTLIWNAEIPLSISDTLETIERGYNLTVAFNPSDVIRVDGYADLTFVRPSATGSWKIARWRDRSNF
ncbi:MAG TPA: hypothetical protein VES59_11250 [Bacteroidota bacterium]|nr:hypothetical protein [Bacteroidota bacterium]